MRGAATHRPALDGFLDSLLQTFENCRPGLPDEATRTGGQAVVDFFMEFYAKERPRLAEIIRLQDPSRREKRRHELERQVDELIRKVVVPAYARLAAPFTLGERNGFYLVAEPLHTAERVAWAVLGIGLGVLAIRAPFIPIWADEWVLVFMVGGLLFPNLRRYFALRHYESELNRLVARADAEIWRMDVAYLTRLETAAATEEAAETEDVPEADGSLDERLADLPAPEDSPPVRDRRRIKGGQ